MHRSSQEVFAYDKLKNRLNASLQEVQMLRKGSTNGSLPTSILHSTSSPIRVHRKEHSTKWMDTYLLYL